LPAAALSTGPGTRLAVRAGKQQPTRPSSANTGAADEQTPVRLTPRERGLRNCDRRATAPKTPRVAVAPYRAKRGRSTAQTAAKG
jgi:hypothetical protein